MGRRQRGRTYNTDHSAVLGHIVRLDLLDEAQGEENGKEANEAEAQGPAPRSTLHVESCVCGTRKGKRDPLALLLAGVRRGREVKRRKSGRRRCRQARCSRTYPTGCWRRRNPRFRRRDVKWLVERGRESRMAARSNLFECVALNFWRREICPLA